MELKKTEGDGRPASGKHMEEPFRIRKPVRLIELFGGIGSQAMVFRDLGVPFEHYRLVEIDEHAVASYNAIHGTDFAPLDIRQIKGADLGIAEPWAYTYFMTYSFPCQDLSVAGRGAGMSRGSGTRSGLLWEVERLLDESEFLPQILLMENVPQVHGKKNASDFQKWIDFLSGKGYRSFWMDLNARDFGIAQNRVRCFCVSILGEGRFSFPSPMPLTKVMKDYLEDEADAKHYLHGERAEKLACSLIAERGILQGDRMPIDLSIKKPMVISTANCVTTKYYGISRRKSSGNGVVELERIDSEDVLYDFYNGKVLEDGLCGTITANGNTSFTHCGTFVIVRATEGGTEQDEADGVHRTEWLDGRTLVYNGGGYVYHIRIRKLTPKECWRLMGFSDEDFRRAEAVSSDTQLYRQAGNSIAENVLVAVIGQMFDGCCEIYRTR